MTDQLALEVGKRYRIQRVNKTVVIGEYTQTRGNDEGWPTFILEDGSLLGVSRSQVLGADNDDCSPFGVSR